MTLADCSSLSYILSCSFSVGRHSRCNVINYIIVVVSSSHQSPSWGVSRFLSAQAIPILLSVWSALKGSRKGGGCHEANDHSCGNGCALRIDSFQVLTRDLVVTGAQLCQDSLCLPWQCLFGCCSGRRTANKQF